MTEIAERLRQRARVFGENDQLYTKAADALDQKDAEISKLTAERDDANKDAHSWELKNARNVKLADDELTAMKARAEQAERALAEAVKALGPFARMSDHHMIEPLKDSDGVIFSGSKVTVVVGDLRRAAAIRQHSKKGK